MRTSRKAGFTLVEIMIVVAIMGVIMAIGIPSIARAMRKEGMRKAVSDLVEACADARAQAILRGSSAELVLHPLDRTFQVIGGGTDADGNPTSGGGTFFSGKFPDNIVIEILGVNFQELQTADEARVHFYANGTSDEFAIVLRSEQHEMRKISLDVVTGLAEVEVVR